MESISIGIPTLMISYFLCFCCITTCIIILLLHLYFNLTYADNVIAPLTTPLCPGTITRCNCVVLSKIYTTAWQFTRLNSSANYCTTILLPQTGRGDCGTSHHTCGYYLTVANRPPAISSGPNNMAAENQKQTYADKARGRRTRLVTRRQFAPTQDRREEENCRIGQKQSAHGEGS